MGQGMASRIHAALVVLAVFCGQLFYHGHVQALVWSSSNILNTSCENNDVVLVWPFQIGHNDTIFRILWTFQKEGQVATVADTENMTFASTWNYSSNNKLCSVQPDAVSITIRNVTDADIGTYHCQITLADGRRFKATGNLSICYNGSDTNPPERHLENKNILQVTILGVIVGTTVFVGVLMSVFIFWCRKSRRGTHDDKSNMATSEVKNAAISNPNLDRNDSDQLDEIEHTVVDLRNYRQIMLGVFDISDDGRDVKKHPACTRRSTLSSNSSIPTPYLGPESDNIP